MKKILGTKNTLVTTAVSILAAASLSTTVHAAGRDTINIVGSSTVYPFSTVVAERYGKVSGKTPKVESTGTGGGMKLFCSGDGIDTPDISNASRRIKQSELDKCFENGVKQVVEIKIGYDGIAFANSKQAPLMKVTREQIYLALAKQIPAANGDEKMIDNPHKLWSDIDKSLPAVKIEVIGPPPTSGTRDSFVELVMEESCKQYAWVANLEKIDKDDFKKKCDSVREDGAYVDAGENDNLIVQKLVANKNAFGIFGFSFLEENADKVQGAEVDGKLPTFETIASGDYKISRPLFFYVKKSHIASLPGIQQFMTEFTSEAAWGEEGYLSEKGMIPMQKSEREQYADDAKTLKILPEKI